MKGLFTGIVLLAVLGICGFLYRYTLEHPQAHMGNRCTAEAKICPDGSSVGRTGAGCTFAACALPNKELPDTGIAFVIPAGYAENAGAITSGDNLLISLEKPSTGTSTQPQAIVIRRYAIPAGKTAEDVILANTQYESSGAQPKAMSEFTPVTIGSHTFQSVTTERFEAQVHTIYYLSRANDVLRFEVLEHNAANWNDPKLSVRALPEHAALERMLGTLQAK